MRNEGDVSETLRMPFILPQPLIPFDPGIMFFSNVFIAFSIGYPRSNELKRKLYIRVATSSAFSRKILLFKAFPALSYTLPIAF